MRAHLTFHLSAPMRDMDAFMRASLGRRVYLILLGAVVTEQAAGMPALDSGMIISQPTAEAGVIRQQLESWRLQVETYSEQDIVRLFVHIEEQLIAKESEVTALRRQREVVWARLEHVAGAGRDREAAPAPSSSGGPGEAEAAEDEQAREEEAILGAWTWMCTTWTCIKSVNGPVYMVGQLFLLYAGFLADTLFIRLTLITGGFCVMMWNILGAPQFPDAANLSAPGIKLDAIVWGVLSILVNGLPALRQFLYNDAKIDFGGGEYAAAKEAMWRIWYRRTGIGRADFQVIISGGEFVTLEPDEPVPMRMSELTSGLGPGGDPGELGDLFYYVAGGRLDGIAHYPEGDTEFEAVAGQFVDVWGLLSLLGQAQTALALQTAPPQLKVASESTFSNELTPPAWYDCGRSTPDFSMVRVATQERQLGGALLFRWTKADLVSKVFGTPSFAPDAMRFAVCQSAIDQLYKMWLKSKGFVSHRKAFLAADAAARRINAGPLPRNAAAQKRSFFRQWMMSNKGWPWRITPQERAINAVRCGSRELERFAEMRRARAEEAAMRDAAAAAAAEAE